MQIKTLFQRVKTTARKLHFEHWAGIVTIVGTMVIAALCLFGDDNAATGSPSLRSSASVGQISQATSTSDMGNGSSAQFSTKDIPTNGIPTTVVRNAPVENVGISKNSEVVLSDEQLQVVKAFDAFLRSRGEWAIVTSGTRTKEGQLDIIKQKIGEKGASARFPKLENASIFDTKIWLAAWQWLRRKHVPVNAPAEVPGADVRTSMHLKGLAIDFISDNLDHLRSDFVAFSRSTFAKQSPLHITGIVREPGCVHINLA